MSSALVQRGVTSAVIFEDNLQDATLIKNRLLRQGVEVTVLMEGFQTIDDCVDLVKSKGVACISDNRLTDKNSDVDFHGVELLARLYDDRIPGLLLSSFVAEDGKSSIREYRDRVPAVVDKRHQRGDAIANGLIACIDEIENGKPSHRVAERNQVWIQQIDVIDGTPMLGVIVPSWDPDHIIRIPQSIIRADVGQVAIDDLLFAYVNTGAEEDEDLYFVNFERAAALPKDFEL